LWLAAKRFQLGAGGAFELRLDCFNVMNVNPVTSIVVQSGPAFGNATASEGGGQDGTGLTPPRISNSSAACVQMSGPSTQRREDAEFLLKEILGVLAPRR
jgi:hypothetical protein